MASQNPSGRAARKKTAMVQPPAGRPPDLPIFSDPALEKKLIKTLKALKNTRAYTVIEYHATWAAVHFEGELELRTINYKD